MALRFATALVLSTAALPTPPIRGEASSTERVCHRESADLGQSDRPLNESVEAYFRSTDEGDRQKLARRIDDAAEGSIERVAEAIRGVTLWSEIPTEGAFDVDLGPDRAASLTYRTPEEYDPDRTWPVVVFLADQGTPPSAALDSTQTALGAPVDNFVQLAVGPSLGHTFHGSSEAASDFRMCLREARRRIHIDSDRVFLFGNGSSGDAAWLTAIANPGLVSGLIVISGYPPLPYPEQFYPVVLENLRHLPVLTVWETDDTAGTVDSLATRHRRVAEHNLAIVEFARRMSLPIVGLALAPDGAHRPKLPARAIANVLGHRRPPFGSPASQWFRYPGEGDLGWLRQTRFKGDVWDAEQLSILATPGMRRDEYITRVLNDKMASIGGRIESQMVTIETRGCARVELLLTEESLDFARPVTVICNGRTRHRRPVHPSIPVLLETAFENWEFERLVFARVSFSIRRDAADE